MHKLQPIEEGGLSPTFSKEIKNAFRTGIVKFSLLVLEDGSIINYDNYLKNVTVSELRFVPDEGIFGQAVAKKVEIELYNEENTIDLQDKTVRVFGSTDYEGQTYTIKYGDFIIQHPENENVNDNTSLTGLDYMIKTNIAYVDSIEYPCTLKELAANVCNQCGLTLADETFRNEDFIVENNQFVNGESCRQVLKGIGLSAFSWVRLDEDNEIHFDFNINQEVEEEIDNDNYYNLDFNNKIYGPINRIIIRDSQIEGENVTVNDENLQNYYPASKNILKGLSTPKTETDYWYIVDTGFTPLEDGWGKFSHDSTNETSNVYTRAIVKSNAVNLKPNTQYTFVIEIRNSEISEDNAITFRVSQATNNSCWKENAYLNYKEINSGGIFKRLITTKENLTDKNVGVNTNLQLKSGTKGTVEARISLFEGDIDITDFKYEPFKEVGIQELVIADNPFAYTQEKRQQLIEAGKELYGFQYLPINSTKLIGYIYLNCNDKIRFKDMQGRKFETFLFNHIIEYDGTVLDNIEVPAMTKTQTQYTYTPEVMKAIKNTQIVVDKANQTITQIIEKQNTQGQQIVNITTNLEGTNTIIENNKSDLESQINDIKQSIEGTTQTLTNKGGNNIFYYDKNFWTNGEVGDNQQVGNLKEYTDTEIQRISVSGNGYIINEGISEQKVLVKNDNYTINFTYKKLVPLANVTLQVNSHIYNLDSLDWKEEEIHLLIDTGTVDFKITSDTDNALMLYDLNGTIGTEKQIWTQNPNETRTETVTIGKGIQVNSSTKNTYARFDADGNRIINKATGDTVTELTDKGVDTESVKANVGEIAGVLIQEIDNQTWISSLL